MTTPPSTTRSWRQNALSPTTMPPWMVPSSNWRRARISDSRSMGLAPIALTMGDPAGIGPEIVARLCAEKDLPRLLVIGDEGMMRRAIALTGVELAIDRK